MRATASALCLLSSGLEPGHTLKLICLVVKHDQKHTLRESSLMLTPFEEPRASLMAEVQQYINWPRAAVSALQADSFLLGFTRWGSHWRSPCVKLLC